MGKLIDIDARRSNREIMDIEVRFEKQDKEKIIRKRIPQAKPSAKGIRLRSNKETQAFVDNLYEVRPWTPGDWRPGDEPGDLGFPEGNEYD